MASAGTALASHAPEYELVESFGPDGSDSTGFAQAGSVAFDQDSNHLYVLDVSEGKLFKFASDGSPVNWGGTESYIAGNEISGLTLNGEWERQVAVDSTTHRVYVTSENSVRAFESDGEPAEFTAGPGAGSDSIGGFGRLSGVAVDSNGYLYASDIEAEVVRIFAPSGEQVTEFPAASPGNLAVDTKGAVYVNPREGSVLKYTPSSPLPVSATTTYTPAAGPVHPGVSFSVAVDPATDNVYIVQFLNEGALEPRIYVYDETGAAVTSFAGSGEIGIAEGITIDEDTTTVYVGDFPFSGVSQVRVFKPKPDEPGAPEIDHLTVSNVDSNSAVLYARVNPRFLETEYWFEIGIEDCSVSICTRIPLNPASAGAGHDGVWVSHPVKGLNPSTTYHYRVVAKNSIDSVSRESTFSTQGTNLEFALSDSRVWEMVSPANKGSAKLDILPLGHVQAAADGNGIAYISFNSIEADPDGTRYEEASSVLARREGSTWRSEDITSPNTKAVPLAPGNQGEFKLFTSDLSEAILDPRDGTSLSPEASERAPYLRRNTRPPSYRPLVTGKAGFENVPSGTEFGGGTTSLSAVRIQAATPDLKHVVLNSTVPLDADAPPAPATSVYRWSDGELEPVSVLPGGEIVSPAANWGGTSLRNAISDDGSRVFWTGLAPDDLYMRDMETEQTIRINVAQGGSEAGEEDPIFQGASSDGSVVYFTDTNQLTEGASPEGRDLYRCELPAGATACSGLVDITASTAEPGESADVQGVVSGLSEDGSHVYFVAKGVLDGDANQFGHVAEPGEPNLYLWREGGGPRFIATLSAEDQPSWGISIFAPPSGAVSALSTAGSPSGRYFAFMSEKTLTDPDDADTLNLKVGTDEGVEQVFLYDSFTARLKCVSCAPTGAAPIGAVLVKENWLVDPRSQWGGRRAAATLPQPTILDVGGATIYQPRAVLENGRVFFNSVDPLVPADSNQQWDVYQYEGQGLGDCLASSGNGAVARTAEGCVSLLSSGTGTSEAGFIDASTSGNDAFFLTPARLTAADVDDEVDVYDARVGGNHVSLSPDSACVGDACRLPSVPVPATTPGSAAFTGAGNVKSKTCPKGKRKVKRRGKQRCVPRKGKKHQRRAGQRNGGAR